VALFLRRKEIHELNKRKRKECLDATKGKKKAMTAPSYVISYLFASLPTKQPVQHDEVLS
jgi:hypothetical protein